MVLLYKRFIGPTTWTMPDEIDLANEQADRWLQQSLAATRTAGRTLQPRGNCHYCEAVFPAEESQKLFCDSDCAKDHETEQRLRNRR